MPSILLIGTIMQLFYEPNISQKLSLSEEDTKHLRVLRKTEGDTIQVVDGKGGLFTCQIMTLGIKSIQLQILQVQENWQTRKQHIHIAIAPTKNTDRLEWFVEKAVEIGIDEVSLILTEHSERRFQKTDRLEKIAVSAMKQSLKANLPRINQLVSFKEFVQNISESQRFIAHLNDSAQPLQQIYQPVPSLTMIGPEGDFSVKEVELAQKQNFRLVSLGNSRLRTETAGIFACVVLNSL